MALLEAIPGIATLTTGWGGTVSATIGATSATITPTVGSPASIWIDLINKCKLTHGGTWEGWADSSGVLYIRHSSSFTLTSSGVTKSRLNLSTTATGASVNGAGAHGLGYYPTGLGFKGYDLKKSDAVGTADGSGSTPLIWKQGGGTITILDTWTNNFYQQQLLMASGSLHKIDLWMGGRSFGRWVVDTASVDKPGMLVDYTTLTIAVTGVAE